MKRINQQTQTSAGHELDAIRKNCPFQAVRSIKVVDGFRRRNKRARQLRDPVFHCLFIEGLECHVGRRAGADFPAECPLLEGAITTTVRLVNEVGP